jgi:hypothetical protein
MRIELLSLIAFKKYPDKSFLRMSYGEQWFVSVNPEWGPATFVQVPEFKLNELEQLYLAEEDEDL